MVTYGDLFRFVIMLAAVIGVVIASVFTFCYAIIGIIRLIYENM